MSGRKNLCFISYAPRHVIERGLEFHLDEIKAYAYIFHDRFSDAEIKAREELGKPPEVPHFHIQIRLWKEKRPSTVAKWFWCVDENGPVNTLPENNTSVSAYYDYLIHKFDPDKFQYSPSDRVVFRSEYFEIPEYSDADDGLLALQMAMVNMRPYEIAKRLGKTFVWHHNDIYDLVARDEAWLRARTDVKPLYTPAFVTKSDNTLKGVKLDGLPIEEEFKI